MSDIPYEPTGRCSVTQCSFNYKGICTNETFDTENVVPCLADIN